MFKNAERIQVTKNYFSKSSKQSLKLSDNLLFLLEATIDMFWKRGKRWNFLKVFSPFCSYLLTYFEICQKREWNLLNDWTLVKGLKEKNSLKEYKMICVKQFKSWTFLKYFFHLGVTYKFVLKSAKNLNWIF